MTAHSAQSSNSCDCEKPSRLKIFKNAVNKVINGLKHTEGQFSKSIHSYYDSYFWMQNSLKNQFKSDTELAMPKMSAYEHSNVSNLFDLGEFNIPSIDYDLTNINSNLNYFEPKYFDFTNEPTSFDFGALN